MVSAVQLSKTDKRALLARSRTLHATPPVSRMPPRDVEAERVVPGDKAACCRAHRGFTGQGRGRPNLSVPSDARSPAHRTWPQPDSLEHPRGCCLAEPRRGYSVARSEPYGPPFSRPPSRAPERSTSRAEALDEGAEHLIPRERCQSPGCPGCLPLIGQSLRIANRLEGAERAMSPTRCAFDAFSIRASEKGSESLSVCSNSTCPA